MLKFQIQCEEQESTDATWTIQSDPQLFSIILSNLLENSIKYASESPIEVKTQFDLHNFYVQISNQTATALKVSRPAELQEKYVRGPTPEPGQGLGLYIAFKIVSILNINLVLEHTNSTFRATLKIPRKLK
jgi:signal transduction histidine kinase